MSEQETGKQVWSIGIDLGTTHCALSYRRPGGTAFELLPVPQFVEEGQWQEQLTGNTTATQNGTLASTVPAHSVRVFVRNKPISNGAFTRALLNQMQRQ